MTVYISKNKKVNKEAHEAYMKGDIDLYQILVDEFDTDVDYDKGGTAFTVDDVVKVITKKILPSLEKTIKSDIDFENMFYAYDDKPEKIFEKSLKIGFDEKIMKDEIIKWLNDNIKYGNVYKDGSKYRMLELIDEDIRK